MSIALNNIWIGIEKFSAGTIIVEDERPLKFVVAGHTGVLADMAGFRMPVEAVALQALVSEPIKPCMDVVVMANTVHGYMSQSDKGELVIGAGTDDYISLDADDGSLGARRSLQR